MDKSIELISIFGDSRDLKRNIHIITKNKIGYIIEDMVYVFNLEENKMDLYKKHIGYIYIFRYSNYLKLALTCDFNNYIGSYVSLWDIDEFKEKYNIKIKNIKNYDFLNYTFNNKKETYQKDISYELCMILDVNFVDSLECIVILTNDKYKTISLWSLSNTEKPFLCIYTHIYQIENLFLCFDNNTYKKNISNNKNVYDYLEYLTILTYSSTNIYIWDFCYCLELKINCFKPIYNNLISLDQLSTIYLIHTNKYYIGTSKGYIYLFNKYIAEKFYKISNCCIKLLFLFENVLVCVLENGLIYRIKDLDNKPNCNKLNTNILINNYYKEKFKIDENIIPFKWISYAEYFSNYLLIVTNTHAILINLYNNEFIILKEIFESDIYISTFIRNKEEYIVAMVTFFEDRSLIRMLNLDNTLYSRPLIVDGRVNCMISIYNDEKKSRKIREGNEHITKSSNEDMFQSKLCKEQKRIIKREKNNITNMFVFSIDNKIVFYEEHNSMLSPFYFISYSYKKYVTCFEFSEDNRYLFCGFNEGSIYIYTIFNSRCYDFYKNHNINKLEFKDMNNNYCIALYKIFRSSLEIIDRIKLLDVDNMKLIVSSNKKINLYNLFENSIKDISSISSNLNLSFFQLFDNYTNDDMKLANYFFKKKIEEYVILNNKNILKSKVDIYLRDVLNEMHFLYKIIYLRKQKKDELIGYGNISTDTFNKKQISYKKEETNKKKKKIDTNETYLEKFKDNNKQRICDKEKRNNKDSYYNLYIFNKAIFLFKNHFMELRKVINQKNVFSNKDTNKLSEFDLSSKSLDNKNRNKNGNGIRSRNSNITNGYNTINNNIIDFSSKYFNNNNLIKSLIFKKDISYTELHFDGNLLICSFKNVVFIYLIKEDPEFHYKRKCTYSDFFKKIINKNPSENIVSEINYENFPIIVCQNDFLGDNEEYYFKIKDKKIYNKNSFQNLEPIKDTSHKNNILANKIINKNEENMETKMREVKNKVNFDEQKYHNVLFMYNDYLSFENCSNKSVYENSYKHNNSTLNSNKIKNILSHQYEFCSYLNKGTTYMLKVPYALDYSEVQKKTTKTKSKEVSRNVYLENGSNAINEKTNNINIFFYKIVHSNDYYEIFIYVKGGSINRVEKTENNSLKFISSQMEEDNVLEIIVPSTIKIYNEQILVQINSLHNTCYLSIPLLKKKEE